MQFIDEIEIYFRARFTLVCVVSYEEERIINEIKSLCEKKNRAFVTWDVADYFKSLGNAPFNAPAAKDPLTALEVIEKAEGEVFFLLKDFHQVWHGQPKIIRKLRNLSQQLKFSRKTIIVTTPKTDIPDELKDDAVIIDYMPPDVGQLGLILNRLTSTPGVKVNLTAQGKEKLLHAALGLSSNQAQRVFAKAIVSTSVLDEKGIENVLLEKKQIIKESGALEFFAPSETINDVGGLEVLKAWLKMREAAFGREARDYGLPEPKGIALIGIPGTGKSLTAKTIAALWRLPLIRLDVGALFGGLVGQSEENTRRALAIAETIAPCLLWIDEIEKGLSVGGGDGGTSMRVFGSILSWMQEKSKPVFVVATANNISALPPELLRKGRFDEIFFLDLPTQKERVEIFKVHLNKRKRFIQNFDLEAMASASEGYVGAEIEQAIIDAMYIAFSDKKNPGRDFTTEDVVLALTKQVPLSRSQSEAIESLRKWLTDGRAQSASFTEATEAEQQFVQILLN